MLKLTGKETPPKVRVIEGIVAQWNGSDDPNGDLSALGANGRIDWICAIPASGTVNLLLQWEVTTTQKTVVYALMTSTWVENVTLSPYILILLIIKSGQS